MGSQIAAARQGGGKVRPAGAAENPSRKKNVPVLVLVLVPELELVLERSARSKILRFIR